MNMKRAGQILRAARKKQKKSLEQIHEETKISLKILKALESDDYSALPPAAFVKGFIRTYAQVLGLSAEKVVAVFRRDCAENKEDFFPPEVIDGSPGSRFWSPKTSALLAGGLILVAFLAYFGWQLKNFFSPPELSLSQPQPNQSFSSETVAVVGKTGAQNSVYVNNELINLEDNGSFSYSLRLFPGENTIEVKAVDRKGRETVVKRKVEVELAGEEGG